ncbi:MAG TPA: hypothetical protein DEP69_03335 [Acidimicrobiaceae bacterium]|nr:hypothetical protein [Acidimicrobiaceae bacterium]
MTGGGGQREEALNTELARLIREANPEIVSKGEWLVSSGAVDILVEVSGQRIAVEAKKLGSGNIGSVGDAFDAAGEQVRKRIKNDDADLGVALVYPRGLTDDKLADCVDLLWIHVRDKVVPRTAQHFHGSAADLAEWLAWLPAERDPTETTKRLKATLVAAARTLPKEDRLSLLAEFGIPKKRDGREIDVDATVRILLTVAAAVMFHCRLQTYLENLPKKEHPEDDHKSDTVKWRAPSPPFDCLDSDAPITDLMQEWELICRVDYHPVFHAAIVALGTLAGRPSASGSIRKVVRAGLYVSEVVPFIQHDLLGGIFHEVLDTARYDGSFYTTTAAATLLAGLAIRADDRDWADPDAARNFRVCDPACGSGTLLLAAMERIYELRNRALNNGAKTGSEDDNTLLAKEMLEGSLWGYDINQTAIHLAATTLALRSPAVDFKQMCLFESKFGVIGPDEEVHLGSVDLIRSEAGRLELNVKPGRHTQIQMGYEADKDDEEDRARNPPDMSLLIMNPPFTRDSLRHDQFGEKHEKMMKAAERRVVDEWKAEYAERTGTQLPAGMDPARLHSSDGLFLILSERLTDADGTLALVLPAVVATSPGALGRRIFLSNRFHIEFVVIPHDPRRIFFSGNTNISEMLIVARRKTATNADNPTRVVKLLRNVVSPLEAMPLAEKIATDKSASKSPIDSWFRIDDVPRERIEEGDWRAVGFAWSWLDERLLVLEDSCLLLGDIAPVGPGGQRTQDAFVRSTSSEERRALWNHKSGIVTSMAVETDVDIIARPGKANLAEKYWGQRRRLLVANRINLPTMRMFAVRAETPTVGSAFVPVAAKDENHEKALCVWLNSTLGTLGMYGNRTLKKLPYPRFSLDDLRSMPVPDLTDAQAAKLAATYDQHATSEMKSFREMNDCETRLALDKAVAETVCEKLGFTDEDIAAIRRGLAAEPSISGKRDPSVETGEVIESELDLGT